MFSTGDAAEICKVSQQTIIRCFDSGRLSGFRVPGGSRVRRIPRRDLLRFMKAEDIPTDVLDQASVRILVVTDDESFVEQLTRELYDQPRFRVQSATNSFDAGRAYEKFQPQLVLLEYLAPDLDAPLVCERIKSTGDSDPSKIIAMLNASLKDRALKDFGDHLPDGVVTTPVDFEMLIERIEGLLAE